MRTLGTIQKPDVTKKEKDTIKEPENGSIKGTEMEPKIPKACFKKDLWCYLCSEESMIPEHAHFRCSRCGWRDSCCF